MTPSAGLGCSDAFNITIKFAFWWPIGYWSTSAEQSVSLQLSLHSREPFFMRYKFYLYQIHDMRVLRIIFSFTRGLSRKYSVRLPIISNSVWKLITCSIVKDQRLSQVTILVDKLFAVTFFVFFSHQILLEMSIKY